MLFVFDCQTTWEGMNTFSFIVKIEVAGFVSTKSNF